MDNLEIQKDEKNPIEKERFNIKEYIKPLLIGLGIALIIKLFVFELAEVKGTSMYPTYNDGNLLFVQKIIKITDGYKRGDIVIFDSHDADAPIYVKRVIGLPKDHIVIKDNKVMINNNVVNETYLPQGTDTVGDIDIVVPDNELFVMGDNRMHSKDSRMIGTINEKQVRGEVVCRINPLIKLFKVNK